MPDKKSLDQLRFNRTYVQLAPAVIEYDPYHLLKLFTEHFKKNYEAECVSALHHNKRKTNYHIHLIFSERQLLKEPIIKIVSRI